jgi:hypothetical protein
MGNRYETVGPDVGVRQDTPDDVGDLADKRGFELIEHVFYYGATRAELERLDGRQVAALQAAGMVRDVERD